MFELGLAERRQVLRARDPNVDRSILAATRELLVEHGYQKTTITAIARRAGVGTSAIAATIVRGLTSGLAAADAFCARTADFRRW